jgi:pimeloyl-ACP methyl ester carboxylesterase
MIGTTLFLAGLCAALDNPTAVSPTEFRAWFDSASAGKLSVPADVGRGAKRFRYVFVGGFANEQMRGYFAENTKELRALGVPRSAIHTIFPSSSQTIEEGTATFREQIYSASSAGPERLVVIAHSRGACDALAFALAEPGFIRDHVESMFLIQGAFGGTALADYVTGDGPAMDDRMPTKYRIVAHLIGRLERGLVDRGDHAGLSALTRGESRPYWARMLELHADAIPILSPKTFFIRSETAPSRLGRFRRAIGWYLTTYDGPNDGIVALKDQYIPGLGTSLCVLECGHGDLTCNLNSSRSARRVRRALAQCIVMAVGRPQVTASTTAAR